MNSPYESPENLVAQDLFTAIFLAVMGMGILGLTVWAIVTGRADAPMYVAPVLTLVLFGTSLYFFGQYREQKQERAKRWEERTPTLTQRK